MKHLSKSVTETSEIAKNFLATITPSTRATIITLSGNLGSGKTTFAQELGKLLGITEDMQSPTFVIEKIYDINFKNFRRLIHIDAYRLEKESELLHLGWQDFIKESENLVLLEWPENVKGIIPQEAIAVKFDFIDEKTREISYG